MIQGIKITQKDFKLIEGKITELLTPLKEFTSPNYQSNGIPTNDGLFILLKPNQQVFIDTLKPLKINWIGIEKGDLKVNEL